MPAFLPFSSAVCSMEGRGGLTQVGSGWRRVKTSDQIFKRRNRRHGSASYSAYHARRCRISSPRSYPSTSTMGNDNNNGCGRRGDKLRQDKCPGTFVFFKDNVRGRFTIHCGQTLGKVANGLYTNGYVR